MVPSDIITVFRTFADGRRVWDSRGYKNYEHKDRPYIVDLYVENRCHRFAFFDASENTVTEPPKFWYAHYRSSGTSTRGGRREFLARRRSPVGLVQRHIRTGILIAVGIRRNHISTLAVIRNTTCSRSTSVSGIIRCSSSLETTPA